MITLFEFQHETEPVQMAEEVGLRVTKLICKAGSPCFWWPLSSACLGHNAAPALRKMIES